MWNTRDSLLWIPFFRHSLGSDSLIPVFWWAKNNFVTFAREITWNFFAQRLIHHVLYCIKMAEDLAHAARMLSQAAERLTTNIESSPSTSQPAVATAATDNGPGRFQRESSTLFPHHFQSTGSRSASFNKPQRSVKCKASETTTKTKRKIICKFVCLSDKEQLETPDAEKQRELLMVGLGETKSLLSKKPVNWKYEIGYWKISHSYKQLEALISCIRSREKETFMSSRQDLTVSQWSTLRHL